MCATPRALRVDYVSLRVCVDPTDDSATRLASVCVESVGRECGAGVETSPEPAVPVRSHLVPELSAPPRPRAPNVNSTQKYKGHRTENELGSYVTREVILT